METYAQFIEEIGLYYEDIGLSRTAGRILGQLLICNPPEQTMPDLVKALNVSKSSISTETRMLIRFGLIERVRLPGDRKDSYRISTDIWERAFKEKLFQLSIFRQLAQKGLKLMKNEPPQHKQRLQQMHDIYAFYEKEMPKLLDKWEKKKRKKK